MKATEVVRLLLAKNRCLERFLKVTTDFEGCFSLEGLSAFEQGREGLLKTIELFDRRIAMMVSLIPQDERTEELASSVRDSLTRKEELVHQIIDLDLKIMRRIEEAKSVILREITQTQKSRDAVTKFKSSWMPESGSGLDNIG